MKSCLPLLALVLTSGLALVCPRAGGEAKPEDEKRKTPQTEERRDLFSPASLTELNRALFAKHPKLVVLSYLMMRKETLLFVITRGEAETGPARIELHHIRRSADELAESVRQFRADCGKPGGGTPDSEELYRLLLAPAEKALDGASQVVIVPDGVLSTLPFHAIRAEEGKYLLERCAVSYTSYPSELPRTIRLGERFRRQRPDGSVLAVGVSDFGGRQRAQPGCEREARAIAQLFGPRAKTLLGRQATKANLRAAWGDCRYLHIATIFLFNADSPLDSALLLGRGDGETAERLLAREILDERVPVELVVLSGSETSLGRPVVGADLLGPRTVWIEAGAAATLASLWSVADDSTVKLMQSFYAALKEGDSKTEALRRAQLTLLKERKTRHPFYWAAFALTGDPW